jgi:hypothetical protein
MRRELVLILIGMAYCLSAGAEIFKVIHADGSIEFTDSPGGGRAAKYTPPKLAARYKTSTSIYRYVSPDGKIYFTDAPKHGGYIFYGRSQPYNYTKFLPNLKINRSRYSDLILATAEKHNLDPDLLHAVIRVESAYNPAAVSSAGAVGLMQLMPDTARRYGVIDRTDPVQNVEGGARYLRDLMAMFDSDLSLAIAAYNAGENAVLKYNYSIPPYPETQNYVRQVLSLYRRS